MMTDLPKDPHSDKRVPVVERPRIMDWVWKPWYARLWWSATALYWSIGALGFIYRPILDLYHTDFAYFLHIVFYPIFALVLMSVGWATAWMNAFDLAEAHPEAVNKLGWESRPYDFEAGRSSEISNPIDPSNPIFIANAEHSAFRR